MVRGECRKSVKGWAYGFKNSMVGLVEGGLISGIFIWRDLAGYGRSYLGWEHLQNWFQRQLSRSQGRGCRMITGIAPLDSWDKVYLVGFLFGFVWRVSFGSIIVCASFVLAGIAEME